MSERFGSVEELLADARSRLSRLRPAQAAEAVSSGARLVVLAAGTRRRDPRLADRRAKPPRVAAASAL